MLTEACCKAPHVQIEQQATRNVWVNMWFSLHLPLRGAFWREIALSICSAAPLIVHAMLPIGAML